jgi:N-acylneuraminate cytidylyltransferase
MRWVALMPLRGGSKAIPHKNISRIAGRPLFAWSLEQALRSECFDELFVASDSEEIRRCATAEFGDRVTVIDRAPENCTDQASTESVLLEFRERVSFDVLCLIQATSPLTRAADFRLAREKFQSENLDSLLTAAEFRRFLWSRAGAPLNYDPGRRPRRQEFEGALVENGAFYFTRDAILKQHCNRLGGRIGIHVMGPETAVEVDDADDWVVAERMLRKRSRPAQWLARKRLRAFVVDVDGTLTDGGMYYAASGEAMKKFDTRDAHGLGRLREHGIRVCVISRENSPAVAARMTKLKIDDYFPGVLDKRPFLEQKLKSWDIAFDEIGYMGDDLPDLECMAAAGASFSPCDAVPEILAAADYVSSQAGGAGAVREVADLIVAARLVTSDD